MLAAAVPHGGRQELWKTQSIFWPDDTKGDLTQALVLLGLVLLMLVVFVNCLGFYAVIWL